MWKAIQINMQNIDIETEKSILIKCPKNSEYNGFKFWYPSKLIKDGSQLFTKKLIYTNDFKFKLIKYGKGKYNSRVKIKEIEINYSEFDIMFECNNTVILEPKFVELNKDLIDNE
jgi:hypothetical protein